MQPRPGRARRPRFLQRSSASTATSKRSSFTNALSHVGLHARAVHGDGGAGQGAGSSVSQPAAGLPGVEQLRPADLDGRAARLRRLPWALSHHQQQVGSGAFNFKWLAQKIRSRSVWFSCLDRDSECKRTRDRRRRGAGRTAGAGPATRTTKRLDGRLFSRRSLRSLAAVARRHSPKLQRGRRSLPFQGASWR